MPQDSNQAQPEPQPSPLADIAPACPPKAAHPQHLVQRSETHRIDTLAIRKVIQALPDNWVIRDLTERDYGIDMMIEYFEGQNPTGRVAFLQIKGTTKPINTSKGTISFSIEKKTLGYTERFAVPFLLVYCNVSDTKSPVYYMWLQKYIATTLHKDYPDWRVDPQETCTVYIPASNTLPDTQDRMLSFCHTPQRTTETLQFLGYLYHWKVHYPGLMTDHLEAATSCKELLTDMSALTVALSAEDSFLDVDDLLEGVRALDAITVKGLVQSAAEVAIVKETNEKLELFETGVLWPHFDLWKLEATGEYPY